jgi:uncharacterized protein (DUF433 family)
VQNGAAAAQAAVETHLATSMGGGIICASRKGGAAVPGFNRITLDPEVMGGKPCIRGLRVTVGTILGLLASGHSEEKILKAYPYLEGEDIRAALTYAT